MTPTSAKTPHHMLVMPSADRSASSLAIGSAAVPSGAACAPAASAKPDRADRARVIQNLPKLLQRLRIERLILNDLYPEIQQHFKAAENLEWLIGDIEQLAFPQALDLAVSSSALQWMADLKSVFRQAHQALQPRGYFCFSTFGQRNLQEIKALTGQGLEYLTLDEIQHLLQQQGFEVLHLSESLDALHFNHPREVLQHLKATGVTAVSAGQRWTKQSLAQFYQGYAQYSQRNDAGQPEYHLSYHPIYCIARRTS